jgi:hypothetical protein
MYNLWLKTYVSLKYCNLKLVMHVKRELGIGNKIKELAFVTFPEPEEAEVLSDSIYLLLQGFST